VPARARKAVRRRAEALTAIEIRLGDPPRALPRPRGARDLGPVRGPGPAWLGPRFHPFPTSPGGRSERCVCSQAANFRRASERSPQRTGYTDFLRPVRGGRCSGAVTGPPCPSPRAGKRGGRWRARLGPARHHPERAPRLQASGVAPTSCRHRWTARLRRADGHSPRR
jgi:hypothetical protein